MHVSKTLETPEGTIKFEGELEQKEADLVVKIGLSVLFNSGALQSIVPSIEGGQTVQ